MNATTQLDPRRPELLNCYAWNCPECGVQNVAFPEPLDLTPGEKREHVAQAEGIPLDCLNVDDEELAGVAFESSPRFIVCANCDLRFEAAPFQEWQLPVTEPSSAAELAAVVDGVGIVEDVLNMKAG